MRLAIWQTPSPAGDTDAALTGLAVNLPGRLDPARLSTQAADDRKI